MLTSFKSPPARPPSEWPRVVSDLRKALIQAGRTPAAVESVLDDLMPVFTAVERARGRVEDELVFAPLGVAADRQRRRAVHSRLRNTA